MAVVALDIKQQVPYAPDPDGDNSPSPPEGEGRGGGAPPTAVFGTAGKYELVEGVASFAVDPSASCNAGITDLGLAPRDERGLVEFSADFCVLRPAGSSGSRRLLFSVANRGRRQAVPFSALSPPLPAEVTERVEPGDGFLLRRGWTIAWCGWQWDVVR